MTLQFLVILVPVVFGFMGFALDLGRIYLIRGELNQAASAMALAAAARLNSTVAATDSATNAANATLDNSLGAANKYNFGSLIVGQGDALLTSAISAPGFYADLPSALAAVGQTGANAVDGTAARHVTINLTADAPLLFWSLFSFGQARKTPIAAAAVAGWSAPVCTACAIEPLAILAPSPTTVPDFGLTPGTQYTLGYQCTGAPTPANIAGTRLQYFIINRNNLVDDQTLYRVGAQGLVTTPGDSSTSCALIGSIETVLPSATPHACATAVGPSVQDVMCGLSTRLSSDPPAACSAVAGTVTDTYSVDADLSYITTDYADNYMGNNRRVMTVPVVDPASNTVLGFRQFLFDPNSASALNNPADVNGRFVVLYLGTVASVKQGRFDGGCGVTSGPGKVVLNQ